MQNSLTRLRHMLYRTHHPRLQRQYESLCYIEKQCNRKPPRVFIKIGRLL